jgi:hypothetical protein
MTSSSLAKAAGVLASFAIARAADVARTPPMGFNTASAHACRAQLRAAIASARH